MNLIRLPILAALTVCLSVSGCDSDSEEVTATASESEGESAGDTETSSGGSSGGSASESSSASSTSGDSATTEASTTTDGGETGDSGSESSGSGESQGCGAATTAAGCQDTASAQCQWFPSATVAPKVANECEDLGFDEGYCLEVDRGNRECSPNFLTTCDAGAVYYREAGLEIGAIELLVFDGESLCDFPSDFAPCQVNSEPKPGSEPSFFPPECACACG